MRTLDLICYGCSAFFLLCIITATVMVFCTGIYACFTKKVKGELFAKIAIVIISGCLLPWLVKFAVYFFTKIFA